MPVRDSDSDAAAPVHRPAGGRRTSTERPSARCCARSRPRTPICGTHLFNADGKLRSFVNIYVNDEDIRYLKREATPVGAGDTVSIVPSVAGGAAAVAEALPTLSNDEVAAIQPAPDHAGGRRRGSAQAEGGARAVRRRRRARIAGVAVSRGRRRRHARPRRLRRRRRRATCSGRFCISTTRRRPAASSRRRAIGSRGLNPDVHVIAHETPLTSANALDIFRDYDVIVDGADNFPTRYLVNDACVLLGKPNVYGSIFRFDGQASVFATKGGPCYRCLYPEPPPPGLVPSCAEGGVLGVLPGVIGTIQATEAIKLILGAGDPLVGRLLLFDALHMDVPDAEAAARSGVPGLRRPSDASRRSSTTSSSAALPGAHAPRPRRSPSEFETTVEELKARIDRQDPIWILDVREPHEFEICRIPGVDADPARRAAEAPGGGAAGPGRARHHRPLQDGRPEREGRRAAARARHHARNLKGGILAWIDRIDPTLPKY